jgi:energy-coupling factor transporter ATP-binding protein EcfA2
MKNLNIKFEEDYVIETTWDYSPIRKNTFTEKKYEKLDERSLNKKISEKSKELGLKSFQRAKLTKKESFDYITREYKTLYKANTEFVLKNGINLLVGDNGCGKSTLIKQFIKVNKENLKGLKVFNVDMEKSNPKVTTPNPEKGFTHSAQEVNNIFMWAAESHGETREGVLLGVLSLDFDMLFLDEPEQGLSLRNQLKYLNKLKETGKPIIISTHSKTFIENVEEVYDVETMMWINSKEYLDNLLK